MGPLNAHNPKIRHNTPSNPNRTRPIRETQQPWTTSRCHRLLRPLKTHISALRRDMGLGDDAGGNGATGTVKPKLQHTYSRRGRRVQSKAQPINLKQRDTSVEACSIMRRKKTTQPGEIILPTPIIRRARSQHLSSPVQPVPMADPQAIENGQKRFMTFNGQNTSSTIVGLEIEMQSLRSRIPAPKFSLYESIFRALYALLVATAEPVSRKTGTRSLMAMCLRQVPEYIGEIEYLEQCDAEDQGTRSTLQTSDISNEMYNKLEVMLPLSKGAEHLRTVVKAHGIKFVKDAMADGIMDDSFSILLVKLCCKTKSFLEGEGLLEELVNRPYPKPKGVDSTFDESRRLRPLKILRDFSHESSRPNFMQRQLSKLIAQQQLPVFWLSTKEFASIWSYVVKTLSGDEACDDTIYFAAQMITKLSTKVRYEPFNLKPQDGSLQSLLRQTFLSAITAISTLPVLDQEARKLSAPQSHRGRRSISSQRVEHVMQLCLCETRRTRGSSWIRTALSMAAFLVHALRDSNERAGVPGSLGRITRQHHTDGTQHEEAAAAVIALTAECCGRGLPQPAHCYLAQFCEQLEQECPSKGFVTELWVHSAFYLAERTTDLRDLAFAELLDKRRAEDFHMEPTRRRKSTSSDGFRWDDDICEWVNITPALKKVKERRNSLGLEGETGHHRHISLEHVEGDGEGEEGSVKRVRLNWEQEYACGMAYADSTPNYAAARLQTISDCKHSPSLLGTKRRMKTSRALDLSEDGKRNLSLLAPSTSAVNGRRPGQESEKFSSCDGRERRRNVALKLSRNALKTSKVTRADDCSDDELGL